jgi:SulP family sulfate permease
VAAVAVPAGLGMGELAGLSPVAGLYATLLPLAAYCLFGSSRQLIVGPEGTLAALTATTVLPLAAGRPEMLAPLAAGLALTIGAVQITAGLLRLGFMADFLSKPVLIGYANGVAAIIIVSQAGKILGIGIDANGFFPQVWEVIRKLGASQLATVVLSAALFVVFYALKRFLPRVPASLVVVVLADAVSAALHLSSHGIKTVGDIPAGLPGFALPGIGFAQWSKLALAAVGIALVGFADTVATARTYAAKNGYDIDANRELLGLGVSNVSAGFTHAFAVGSSGSRTAINDSTGGTSQVTALVAAGIAVLVALFATPLIGPLPKAVLGVVVVTSAIGLINIRGITRLRRVHNTEVGLAIATLLGVLIFDVLGGLLLAIALSIGVYVYRSVRPHDAVLASVSDLDGYRDIAAHPDAADVPGLLVYRFDAPLYFANAAYFADRLTALVAATDPPPRWVVLNSEAVIYIDATAVDALHAVRSDLTSQGITFGIARLHAPIRRILDTSGYTRAHGEGLLFYSVRSAVDAYLRETRSTDRPSNDS